MRACTTVCVGCDNTALTRRVCVPAVRAGHMGLRGESAGHPGPTPEELKAWFGDAPVVRLQSAYNANVKLSARQARKIQGRLKEGVKKATVRQY